MAHLVAAPDKFRGTASAAEIATAAAGAARQAGWTADEVPVADGGEGTLEVVGGAVRYTTVTGPLGEPVEAEWRMVMPGSADPGSANPGSANPGGSPTAVIETARAAGRSLIPRPGDDDPLRASTTGVGQLVLAAVDAGAGRVVVGVGGSATTDGGWGAVEVIGSRGRLGPVELLVACDVQTPFLRAAEVFGPQKGATAEQVVLLTRRLRDLADAYHRRFGVDVTALPGGGAGGGLAGGLAAVGGRLVPGFSLVAEVVGLAPRLALADLVMTGEGHLDLPSLEGKVVGEVIAAVRDAAPVLCIVGDADPAAVERLRSGPGRVEVVSLTDLAGPSRARSDTVALVAAVVQDHLARHRAGS